MNNAFRAGLLVTTCLLPGVALAQVATPDQATGKAAPEAAPWTAPATFGEWASNIKLSLQGEGGFVVNKEAPGSGVNFGQLFTDRANRPILNQLLGTVSRDLDPKATSYDVGFRAQLLYGSDARIVHSLGVLDQLIHDRNQLDVNELSVSVHTPWLFEGGIDFKGGLYPTPLGFETIDPKTNPFYTHSYIFNYGLPFKHTGGLMTAHVTSVVDVYLGIDTGTNTSYSDNNDRPGGIAGLGLNLGKLTVLALTHIGPEDPTRSTPFGNSAIRYFNDVVFTYKQSDKLSFTTELNYVKEDGFRAEGYGAAQYVSYALSDELTLNGRAEIWRDNSNFFVSNPVGNRDYINAQRGAFAQFITAPRAGTYTEFTAGATYKPGWVPKSFDTVLLRPEVRYDSAINGAAAFNDGKNHNALTLAADIVMGF